MDREVAEISRMATTLIFIGAVLFVTILAFTIAREYAGEFFNTEAERVDRIDMAGLSGLSIQSGSDMPVAALYSLVAREWRNIQEVRMYTQCTDAVAHAANCPYECSHCNDKHLIVVCAPSDDAWSLTPGLKKGEGSVVNRVSGPEQALYAKRNMGAGGSITDSLAANLGGRVFVTIEQDMSTYLFVVVCQWLS